MTSASPLPVAAGKTFSDSALFGIYIHIPFCGRKCPYCDFYSTSDLSRVGLFREALIREIHRRARPARPVDTIYFGGGTPSVVPASLVTGALAALRAAFALAPHAEITVEVNPESASPEKLAAYREAGINRVSIGAQSFCDKNLRLLGRRHNAAEAVKACENARAAGFENLSLDLIYGLPGQGQASWQEDLETAIALGPEHLSCYTLTFEPRTVFAARVKKGQMKPLPEGKVGDLFLLTGDFLVAHGYVRYEISNFARRDPVDGRLLVSRHNTRYWTLAPYQGFGPAAHSLLGSTRSWNVSSVRRYIEEVANDKTAVAGREKLTKAQQMTEALYLGLRTSAGIDMGAFNRRFAADFSDLFGEKIDLFEKKGLVAVGSGFCRLTRQGMLVLDAVVGELVLNY